MSNLAAERPQLVSALKGKHVFVTGGTGSFGATFVDLCLAQGEVSAVTVYSRDEQKHVMLRRRYTDARLRTVVGDVRDLQRLRFAIRGAQIVFNAAAIKHVHLTEAHPMEAVLTNIIGAWNVCTAAVEAGVEVIVSLSTDKAVEPVNAMGMSKALQERVVASFANAGPRVGIVRYGNVLASNGSVVPYFKHLLESGADRLPVTDRRMTRFVLTLKDSVDLVLMAMRDCRAGEIYVLDLPSFLIWDVAQVMARTVTTRQVTVDEIGIRPGEKVHETLVSAEEMRRAIRQGMVYRIDPFVSTENLSLPGQPETSLSSRSARRLDQEAILDLLKREGCLPGASA